MIEKDVIIVLKDGYDEHHHDAHIAMPVEGIFMIRFMGKEIVWNLNYSSFDIKGVRYQEEVVRALKHKFRPHINEMMNRSLAHTASIQKLDGVSYREEKFNGTTW